MWVWCWVSACLVYDCNIFKCVFEKMNKNIIYKHMIINSLRGGAKLCLAPLIFF